MQARLDIFTHFFLLSFLSDYSFLSINDFHCYSCCAQMGKLRAAAAKAGLALDACWTVEVRVRQNGNTAGDPLVLPQKLMAIASLIV